MATTAGTNPQSEWDREKPRIRSLFLYQDATMAEIVSELASRGLGVTSVLPKARNIHPALADDDGIGKTSWRLS